MIAGERYAATNRKRQLWFYLLISPVLAISVALPLFLIARQRVVARQRAQLGVR